MFINAVIACTMHETYSEVFVKCCCRVSALIHANLFFCHFVGCNGRDSEKSFPSMLIQYRGLWVQVQNSVCHQSELRWGRSPAETQSETQSASTLAVLINSSYTATLSAVKNINICVCLLGTIDNVLVYNEVFGLHNEVLNWYQNSQSVSYTTKTLLEMLILGFNYCFS